MEKVELGKILDTDPGRDAVHIAVLPATAGEKLWAGYRVGWENGVATTATEAIGIVDPFIEGPVLKGQRFYLCLFPNTVTSLRHVWVHPAVVRKAVAHV